MKRPQRRLLANFKTRIQVRLTYFFTCQIPELVQMILKYKETQEKTPGFDVYP